MIGNFSRYIHIKKNSQPLIKELKDFQREVVSLKSRGFSAKEIGKFIEKSEDNVRVILLRSRKQLASCLGGYLE